MQPLHNLLCGRLQRLFERVDRRVVIEAFARARQTNGKPADWRLKADRAYRGTELGSMIDD